ncbi:MAG: type 4a pilus biogenesis protein PilO [Gammaproteobacteria bacterium]|nr:type 4a pilus biogenesis protein PilO [Gammaproteobacteria bacterium]
MMQSYLTQLDNRSFLVILAGLLLLIATALTSYGLWPQFKQYRAELSTRNTLKDVIDNGDALENELSALQVKVETLRHKLHGGMTNLPIKQMESYIIGRLQTMSWRHGVELSSIQPGAGQRVEMFKEILFDIELSGDYFNLVNWLKDLGKELGFVVIKEYEMKSEGHDTNDKPRLALGLTIVSYRAIQQ